MNYYAFLLGVDIFGFGTLLNNTRIGAYIQRLSSAFYENAINNAAAPRIDHGSWSFDTHEWSSTPTSDYLEPVEPCRDLISWVIMESLCPEFEVDQHGSLRLVSLSAYVSFNLISLKIHLIIKVSFGRWLMGAFGSFGS